MYPSKPAALALVKSEAGITDASRDSVLNDWLESSKGQYDGADEYRPYLVIAIALHTSKGEQTLVSAESGIKFRQSGESANLLPVIRANLRIQQQFDTTQQTEIPAGWDVQTWLDSLCGCEGPGEAVSSGGKVNNPLGALIL